MYFSDATKTKNGWANELLHEFECNVEMLKQAVKDHNVGSPPKSPNSLRKDGLLSFKTCILSTNHIRDARNRKIAQNGGGIMKRGEHKEILVRGRNMVTMGAVCSPQDRVGNQLGETRVEGVRKALLR